MMKLDASCDYCGADLGCKEDSPESLGYWRTQYALYVCDKCLPKCSSDFPEKEGIERRFALRALHVRGVDLDDSAARVEWNTTNGLHGLVALMPEIARDRRSEKQHSDAGFSSGAQRKAERKPEWDQWQAEIDDLHARNSVRSMSDVQTAVAKKFGVSRTTIRNRTKWPEES